MSCGFAAPSWRVPPDALPSRAPQASDDPTQEDTVSPTTTDDYVTEQDTPCPTRDPAHPHAQRHPELSIDFHDEDDILIVTPTGELDIYTVPLFRRQLDRHDRPGIALIIDLSHVNLIDSCGLGLLVSLHNRSAISHRAIALVLTDRRLTDILRITGLGDAFVQVATVDAARTHITTATGG
jgi:anti-sigma B factor antagonist